MEMRVSVSREDDGQSEEATSFPALSPLQTAPFRLVTGTDAKTTSRSFPTTEDILEQLTDDYLQFRGYFTQHNIKYRPRSDQDNFEGRQDSNHSDIDVLGFNRQLEGPEQVWAVSCKSW